MSLFNINFSWKSKQKQFYINIMLLLIQANWHGEHTPMANKPHQLHLLPRQLQHCPLSHICSFQAKVLTNYCKPDLTWTLSD
jgi:hypothetical protein